MYTTVEAQQAIELTEEQKYEFDLKGYYVLKGHYAQDAIREFHEGIDELQAIPVDYKTYTRLGIASYLLARAMRDPGHEFWTAPSTRRVNPKTGGVWRVDHGICGTEKFDRIVRDPVLKSWHTTLHGGRCFISATYFIEKVGPSPGGRLHNGGYPLDREIFYRYDHTKKGFACSSTKSVVILSDQSKIENGPFAAIPGSHKANLSCPFNMDDALKNPAAVPVLAEPGDVIIFTEAMTHNAFPVTNKSVRRSVFFNHMPAIGRDNLPGQRQSIYPKHVLKRLKDVIDMLESPAYI